jgi:predicted porin
MRRVRFCAQAAVTAAALFAGVAGAAETRGALYGDLRLSFDHTDDDTMEDPASTTTDNQSVWGVKVSTARGGVTVFGAYERYIETDDPNLPGVPVELTRQAWIGLTSLCGTVKAGRHATAYSEAGRKLDPFYDTAASGIGGVVAAGSMFGAGNSHGTSAEFNADALGGAYVADHIAYRSPAFYGLTGNVAVFLDEEGTSDPSHGYGVGAEYLRDGITAGVQVIDANSANELTWGAVGAMRLYGGYAHEKFGAGVSWEQLDHPGDSTAGYLMVSGWYGLTEHTRIAASIGSEDDTATDGGSVRAGVFHDLIEDFTVWAAVLHYTDDSPLAASSNVVTFGASYKFNLGFNSD